MYFLLTSVDGRADVRDRAGWLQDMSVVSSRESIVANGRPPGDGLESRRHDAPVRAEAIGRKLDDDA